MPSKGIETAIFMVLNFSYLSSLRRPRLYNFICFLSDFQFKNSNLGAMGYIPSISMTIFIDTNWPKSRYMCIRKVDIMSGFMEMCMKWELEKRFSRASKDSNFAILLKLISFKGGHYLSILLKITLLFRTYNIKTYIFQARNGRVVTLTYWNSVGQGSAKIHR